MAAETYPGTAFSAGVARGRLADTIAADPVIGQASTYIALHSDGSVVINFAVALTVPQKAALDAIVAAHNGRPLPTRSDLGTLATVANRLEGYGFQAPETALLTDVYESLSEVPTPPPAGLLYALVGDTDLAIPKVAYWDTVGLFWVLRDYPWRPPELPLPPGASWVVHTDPTIGTGNNNWSYIMGTEIHITQPSSLAAMAVRLASAVAGTQHTWTIRKSNTPGAAPPLLTSYTQLLASGVVTIPAGGGWVDVGVAPGAGFAVNDWVIGTVSVQQGGMLASVNATRADGGFDESKATVNGGLYIFNPEALPGVNPNLIPTTRASTLYGMTSLALQ